ncbi:Shedu immune nuclease family protein [Pseudoxanthomonas mexicana]
MSRDDDEHYVANKVPGRIYGSRAFNVNGYVRTDQALEKVIRKARYLDRVFPDIDGDVLGIVRHEQVLRTTPTGKRQVKLLLIEDPRGIRTLTLQNFDMSDGKDAPSKNTHFSLIGNEIDDLLEIAYLARNADFQADGKFRIGVNQLQRIALTQDAAKALIGNDTKLIESILENEVTERDVVAIGYRKRQLKIFERLLQDDEYFASEVQQVAGGAESVWQTFFENNHWIFGASLFLTSAGAIDEGKLERSVAGASVAGPGKRVDALLRTRGRVGALCFVEIKTHKTPLLKGKEYRNGVWQPSEDLIGAVAQSHRTVQLAEQTIQRSLRVTDAEGNPTGRDAYMIRPRSVVVCGDLGQFVSEHGVNEEKYASFEIFRRHLQGPEIVTFDELLERAKLIVEDAD